MKYVTTTCTREHTISCGHRVEGHESKCANFHGHNYTIEITARPRGTLDNVGRVVDFAVIKAKCCQWLEDNWDHRFLLWERDTYARLLSLDTSLPGLVLVPFNPTAENMAQFLCDLFDIQLFEYGVTCVGVKVIETPKCWAEFRAE